jgi:hypothetical protein
LKLTTGVIVGAVLSMIVVSALWWLYFDVAAIMARRRSGRPLRRLPQPGRGRTRLPPPGAADRADRNGARPPRKQLQEAERSFRDLKGTLLLRPVFHRKDDRIRARVLICSFQSDDGDFTQTSELTAAQRDLHADLGVPPPPRFGRITPAATPAA